jgi:hypothetical protein
LKLYLSDQDVDVVIDALKGVSPERLSLGPFTLRAELLGKLLKARDNKDKNPVVGAINVTGTIETFADITGANPGWLSLHKITQFPALRGGELRIYVDRDAMLAVLRKAEAPYSVMEVAKAFPYFPAPNPDLLDDKNALGQTEEQFWAATDAMLERA